VYLLSLVFVSFAVIKHWDTPALPFTHQFLRHPARPTFQEAFASRAVLWYLIRGRKNFRNSGIDTSLVIWFLLASFLMDYVRSY
jgi:hypothetical protein